MPDTGRGSLVSLSFLHIPYYAMGLIGLSLSTVTIYGMVAHIDKVTSTHCRVPNVFPTISAAIRVSPERYIWRVGVGLASSPCMIEVLLYYSFFSKVATSIFYKGLNLLLGLSLAVENLSLVGLTFVSSTENYIIHRNSFISFIVASMIHMCLFLLLFKMLRQPPSQRDQKSFKMRLIFATLHILFFALSIYFFWRHNAYCEPYVYSLYGFFEYLVVFTNIAFRACMMIDFSDYQFLITPLKTAEHKE